MEEKRDGILGNDSKAQGKRPAEDDRSPQPAKGGVLGTVPSDHSLSGWPGCGQ